MDHMLIPALVFLVISMLISMLGMGGGILYVPILLLAGFDISSAPSISLILIAATSLAVLPGSAGHAVQGQVDRRTGGQPDIAFHEQGPLEKMVWSGGLDYCDTNGGSMGHEIKTENGEVHRFENRKLD
ncbi:sulfite exporter TauE/SafE family protein [Pontiella agarivorans]|uniref:Sulfite exporter TauE/SafE family protein n=1 Tax=Pontiella agarivorans TaxID=3038953 RepID=A0ABU5MVI4_9BACT|nr:sulfite exporter TauE/SafE family protein [Pontiella agarivorans]MDZ8118212.1 sulfite exporter TauE/SafE family protein [Pontiella agarivorans]